MGVWQGHVVDDAQCTQESRQCQEHVQTEKTNTPVVKGGQSQCTGLGCIWAAVSGPDLNKKENALLTCKSFTNAVILISHREF